MKIVQVINTIISNPEKISDVYRNEDEYFFVYDNKYKWSETKSPHNENQYYVHLYPTTSLNIEELAHNQDWNNFTDFVTYSTEDLKTREALESFRELYQIVADKVFGIDDIFNDIIGNV